ncbi:unnamed protein product, partial [Rotaria sp. Silwood1]
VLPGKPIAIVGPSGAGYLF